MIGWDQTFLPSETDDKLRKNTYYLLRRYCDEVVSVGEGEDEVAIQGVKDDEHVVVDEVTGTVPVQKARGGGDRENGWGGMVLLQEFVDGGLVQVVTNLYGDIGLLVTRNRTSVARLQMGWSMAMPAWVTARSSLTSMGLVCTSLERSLKKPSSELKQRIVTHL